VFRILVFVSINNEMVFLFLLETLSNQIHPYTHKLSIIQCIEEIRVPKSQIHFNVIDNGMKFTNNTEHLRTNYLIWNK
jgi:hypothetical protein